MARTLEQPDNWTTLLQRPARCQPRSFTFRHEIGRSPRAPTSTRKMQTQLLSAQDSAARHRHLRQLWISRNHRTISFAERNCSSCQEYMRLMEDQLHITDNPKSGSGSGRAPSPDSPTVENQSRIRSLTSHTANRNPTLTVIATI